jgi:hypothetical protein
MGSTLTCVRKGAILTLAIAAVLAAPAVADAKKKPPKLKASTAKKVTKEIAAETASAIDGEQLDDVTLIYVRDWSVGPCERRSRRKVECRYELSGALVELGEEDFPFGCWSSVTVKYKGNQGKKIRTRESEMECA